MPILKVSSRITIANQKFDKYKLATKHLLDQKSREKVVTYCEVSPVLVMLLFLRLAMTSKKSLGAYTGRNWLKSRRKQ